MARYGVTFEKVADIANQLAANDINPTVDRVREKLGTGSKSTIAKHLKRWRTQAEFSSQQQDGPLSSYDPEQIPEPLMALMRDFWQSFYRTQVADEHARRGLPPAIVPQQLYSSINRQDAQSHLATDSTNRDTKESLHDLQEQMQMIQDYVVGLEAELAESTALGHRLAHRLEAFYRPILNTEATLNARGDLDIEPPATDLADPDIYAMPIVAELTAIQATLSRVEQSHSHLAEDLEWATRSAFNLAHSEEDLRHALHQALQQLDAAKVREAALTAENDSLNAQIIHLRRALALRQRFIERLEGEVLSVKPPSHAPLATDYAPLD